LALPVALAAVCAGQSSPERRTRMLMTVLATGAVVFLLYRICPVVGPADAFATVYPAQMPIVSADAARPIWTPGRVPRNGMPSLHAAWALLMLLNIAAFPRRW